MLDNLPTEIPGIYTLGRGRQISKTTLLKQCMQELMLSGIPADSVTYFSGELIIDQTTLFDCIKFGPALIYRRYVTPTLISLLLHRMHILLSIL